MDNEFIKLVRLVKRLAVWCSPVAGENTQQLTCALPVLTFPESHGTHSGKSEARRISRPQAFEERIQQRSRAGFRQPQG